ncbi:hypothetical protein C8R43DRAFT_965514 [Mycena crocata]|nr:hypothetical protein C8R43DRAFT_965514 [Mycena crocata]
MSTHKGAKNQRLMDIFKHHTPGGNLDYVPHIPLSKSETRTGFIRWISKSLRPFVIAADRGFRYLMRSGRPTVWIPSSSTIARDEVLFNKTRDCIRDSFNVFWQPMPPNHRTFVAMTGHWEENGEKIDCLLDFVEVPGSHTGETLANVLADIATAYGIEDWITSIINLVAKSFLRLVDTVHKAGDGDGDEEETEELPDLEDLLSEMNDMEQTEAEGDDSDDIFDERANMLNGKHETFFKETTTVCRAIGKVRTIATKILDSPTKLRPRWDKIVKSNCLPPRVLPRDVKTRWNSTYDMINIALAYRRAVHEITLDRDASNTPNVNAFKDATLYFSRDLATIVTIIPAIDKLDSMLATAIITKPDGEQKTFTPTVQIALVYAKKTLNRYYAKAYYNRIQHICLRCSGCL